MTYEEFLKTKAITVESCGFECEDRNPKLFDWQNDVVRWALRKGKCAIFTGCGSGKTRMQLQWGQKVHEHTGKPILILCPLAVAQQTKREGEACGIEVNVVRNQGQCVNGINVTNYEMLPHFEPENDTVSSFLKKREEAVNALLPYLTAELPRVFVGAEVLLCEGMEKMPDLDKLTVAGTNLLLLERPFLPLTDGMAATIAAIREKGFDFGVYQKN